MKTTLFLNDETVQTKVAVAERRACQSETG